MARSGSVAWITGLSGAGKSEVAGSLVGRLHERGTRPVLLDGDELRETLGVRSGYDLSSRRALAATYARMCLLLSGQGHVVVCATISLHHDIHDWNREHLPGYLEVFLDVPVGELRRRDPKGIYRDGTDIVGTGGFAAEFPLAPDLRIRNVAPLTAREAGARIFEAGAGKGMW
ncbi:Adenylylsulfate kinase [Prauserella marina]|uniref:Adenylylsulfate kinase n=1 Tax=Prauserella marina TaxID=530584 RepID=A0A1G6TI52_9PSEU|nr:adenylyl-sulfate kinase [Prauserella marina]PWV75688.1 adenylylsulfate kinase-like enzyme [Prauserella marina]SDD28721.1 Adenylylsulfate kinase [Prauserella marina]